ncbi:hypothetical protein [Polystyrenella longa]|nr:hypothetical protein [Polystyrenella longa]
MPKMIIVASHPIAHCDVIIIYAFLLINKLMTINDGDFQAYTLME